MRVLMMLVVTIPMFMLLVPLSQMQPEAEAHQATGNEQLRGWGLAIACSKITEVAPPSDAVL